MAISRKRKLDKAQVEDLDQNNHEVSILTAAPFSAASPEEKLNWQGFCEIENDPAFFNVMLKDFGVKGIEVREVFGLNEELLAMLPQPVYGLIYLYRYRASNENNQESICPDHVWFANQTHDHACATVSLLNIVLNIPDIELGENLSRFKEFTKDFPPSLKGDQIGNFEFLKQIHNSFARKMDMMNIDLSLENQYDERRKSKKLKTSDGEDIDDDDDDDDESAYHFIAFVPIGGEVWKLDGLNRQPQKLGEHAPNEWLAVATPFVAAQMAEYEEGQIEFGLLSLVKNSLQDAQERLIEKARTLKAIEARMEESSVEDGIEYEALSHNIEGLDTALDHFGCSFIELRLPESLADVANGNDYRKLESLRDQLVAEMTTLIRTAMEEEKAHAEDQRKAEQRRHDYGPLIYMWLRMLAEKEDVIHEMVDKLS